MLRLSQQVTTSTTATTTNNNNNDNDNDNNNNNNDNNDNIYNNMNDKYYNQHASTGVWERGYLRSYPRS